MNKRLSINPITFGLGREADALQRASARLHAEARQIVRYARRDHRLDNTDRGVRYDRAMVWMVAADMVAQMYEDAAEAAREAMQRDDMIAHRNAKR